MKTKLSFALLAALGCQGANLPTAQTDQPLVAAADYRVTPPPHNTKWAVILCKTNDHSEEPISAEYYRNLFTESGAGTGGLFDYWRDQSYGNVDLTGSIVSGWYTVPRSGTEEQARTRNEKIEDCVAAAGNAVDWTQYYDVITIYNSQQDLGSAGDTLGGHDVMAVVADNLSPPNGIAHEMGHGFTLDHSLDDTKNICATYAAPGEYCDPFDLMSAMVVQSFHSTRGPTDCFDDSDKYTDPCRWGPSLNAWNRYVLGWMPGPRIALWNATGGWAQQTFTLAALNHPEVSGSQMLRVPIVGDGSQYIVEFVMNDGWDRGLSSPTVLIHRITGGDWHSYLVEEQWGPRRLGGTSYSDTANNVEIIVSAIDATAMTATITVQLDHLPPSTGGGDGTPPDGCYYDAYGHLKCNKNALQGGF
jgi:M6 family metalloprotease-like protein